MKLDLFSYLLGQKSVKIPTPPPQKELPNVSLVGYSGDGAATAATSLDVWVGISSGYKLISVMHREDLTTPSDCTLLDKSTYTTSLGTQYVSLFKTTSTGLTGRITFTQASSARISATVWEFSDDFNVEKVDTKEWEIFTTAYNFSSKDFLYITVSSVGSTGSSSVQVSAEPASNCWINEPMLAGHSQTVLRHFSAIHFPTAEATTVYLKEYASDNGSHTTTGQAVAYKITKAD